PPILQTDALTLVPLLLGAKCANRILLCLRPPDAPCGLPLFVASAFPTDRSSRKSRVGQPVTFSTRRVVHQAGHFPETFATCSFGYGSSPRECRDYHAPLRALSSEKLFVASLTVAMAIFRTVPSQACWPRLSPRTRPAQGPPRPTWHSGILAF